MKHFPTLVFALFFLFGLTFFTTGCGNGNDEPIKNGQDSCSVTGKFFTLSDIHFDPFYDTSLVMQLVNADAKEWKKIFESSSLKDYGVYGKDANFNLMTSAFEAMHKVNSKPDFIVITGDFLSHKFQHTFDTITGIKTTGALENFITKTIQFIAKELMEKFPGTPIYPVLGNNDDFCGDYMIQPHDPFLPVFSKAWASALNSIKGENTFAKSVDSTGYYMASLPGFPNHVIIGMNSIFFSAKDSSTCLGMDTTSGHVEMNWLNQTLASCQQKNMKVWLTCHIPPGVNVKSTAKDLDKNPGDCKIKMMWKEDYNNEFLALENQYSSVIVGGLAGHTHMDDFRVVSDTSGKPISFFHINPSISPIDSNNAGFQLFTYDPASMVMLNYKTYEFQGLEKPNDPTWEEEYDYHDTYLANELSGQAFYNIWQTFSSDKKMREKYQHFYGGGSTKSEAKPWKYFGCGLDNMTQQGFENCSCGNP
jgi:sphingomyelin phosphodiesterase acid-like 3